MAEGATLEERRFELEAELKRRELAIKEAALNKKKGLTAAQATLGGSLLALLSAIIGGLVQGFFTQNVEDMKEKAKVELEKSKFETTLILKATEVPNREDQIRNLQFFLNAGFIHDPEGKIAKINPADYPSTASSVEARYNRYLDIQEKIGKLDPIDLLASAMAEKNVQDLVHVQLSKNQRSALALFQLSIGTTEFAKSRVLKVLNEGNYGQVPTEMNNWAPSSGLLTEEMKAARKRAIELWNE